MTKFKVGDIVKPNAKASEHYTETTKRYKWVGKIVQIDGIRFSAKTISCNSPTTPTGYVFDGLRIDYFDIETPKEKAKPEPKALDALVIEKEAKEEIEAVIKQHKNGETLFKTWGLGDVIEYGRAMSFLFYGAPGTGKTWAAHCIAKVLGKELMTIGIAEIQSSEPGAAARNIQDAFKAAKEQDKVLFIDECDSLITSRNTVGMVLGGEINTLLTSIEKYDGVVVLATNRIEQLDEALERRISLIVEFKEPDHASRKEIWTRMLPDKMPVAKDVTPAKLAEYKLTGGQIKNAVLQAARLALATESNKVELFHFEAAINRINKSKSLLGSASRYSERILQDIGTRIAMDVDVVRSDDIKVEEKEAKAA